MSLEERIRDHNHIIYDPPLGYPKTGKLLYESAAALKAAREAINSAHVLIDLLKEQHAVSGYPREWSIVDNKLRAALALLEK